VAGREEGGSVSAAATSIDYLIDRAGRASEGVAEGRESARRTAVAAIRLLERRLRVALRGDPLRGMVNLVYVRGVVQQAARVVGREGAHTGFFEVTDERIDKPIVFGTSAMVLTRDGELARFSVTADGAFSSRPVRDDELTAQDLDAVVHTARRVLQRHVERADRTAANYARLSEMAGALSDAIR